MKLTTATLKKLIREELNRMNEMDQQNPQHKDIFMIIVNAGMEQGLPEPVGYLVVLLRKQPTRLLNLVVEYPDNP